MLRGMNTVGWAVLAKPMDSSCTHGRTKVLTKPLFSMTMEIMPRRRPYWIVDASLPQFYGVIYGQSDWDQNYQTIVNDLRIPFPGSNIGSRAENSNVEVRLGWDFDNRFGEGDIAEHFIYGTKLFESHRTIVSNYVAARYGISMGSIQHYFREDFSEDVAGIGRENEWDQHDDAQGIGLSFESATPKHWMMEITSFGAMTEERWRW